MTTETTRAPAYAFNRWQKTGAVVAAALIVLVFQETFSSVWASWQRQEYSHCFLIPLLSGFLLWQRWPQIRQQHFTVMGAGVLVVLAGFTALFLDSAASRSFEAYALVVVIGGCLLTLMGWNAFKLALGPVALLLLAIPLPQAFHDALSSELQLLSSQLGAGIIRLFGISVFLDGTVIDFGARKLQLMELGSGLNYLLPLLTLGTLMAFFVRGRAWVRVAIVLSTIPIAILMNGVRIGMLGIQISRAGGSLQFLHLFEGWAIFMACVVLLIGEFWLLLKVSGDQRQLREALTIEWPGTVSHAGPAPGKDSSRPSTPHARVLVVTGNFAPEITGIGKYVGEMTAWMSEAGFEIRVVTAPPYYPAWRVIPGYSSRRYSLEQRSGALVYRCPLFVPRRPRGVTRLLHTLSFALSTLPVILWQALFWRPQLVFVVEPPLTCAPAAVLGAWLCGARSWLHVQDFEVDAAFELGLLRNARLRRLSGQVERWLMRRFDVVSSISPRMLRKLLRKGVERTRMGYFPNWVDTTLIKPVSRENRLREELGIPSSAAVFLYSGNMGEKQGLELLVQAARIFAATSQDVLFLLCGDGAAKGRIMAAAKGLSNVRFLPLQPLSRLNELLGLADVHMLPQRMGAEDLVMPSKLTAIMASGRPVVASARMGSDLARAASAGGLIAPPGDASAFACALQTLLGDADLRAELGRCGRLHAIQNWDRETILRNAERELHAVLGESVLDGSVLGDGNRSQEKMAALSMVRLR